MKRSPIARSAPPRKRKRRTAAEERAKFAREFGSQERHDWIQTLPCCACGVVGYSENAHVGNKGAGTGRKADYDQIAPLCGPRGCHQQSHDDGQQSFEREYGIDLLACAAECERAWQERGEAAA